jgi:hypothetical protein
MTRHGCVNSILLYVSKIKVNKKIRHFIAKYSSFFLITTLVLVFYIFNSRVFIVLLFFIICILSMQHLRYFSWLGVPDMNLILTVYTSMVYGLPTGLLLGCASFFGLILSGDIDSNIFYDLVFSYITAILASFFSINLFIPVVIIMSIIHFIGFIIFHKLIGTLDLMNLFWVVTHLLWVIFFATKICKLFLS